MYYTIIITYQKRKGDISLKEVIIDKNDSGQRLDRFLKKYLKDAPLSFIYKMLRKKNIKINNKKGKPDMIISEGDVIQLFLSDETIEKFRGTQRVNNSKFSLNIIYEDENIILINKPVGFLSHSANKEYGNNVVDGMIQYLYEKGEYNPRVEKTFRPSICNRLDRNTSGIIIGAKNYEVLRQINASIKAGEIHKYYKTIVKGQVKEEGIFEGYLAKDEELNKVKILDEEGEDTKKILTKIRVLKTINKYSLLEIELITGRTHQIRAHLSNIGHPIIGDIKYGDKSVNKYFRENYGLNSQFLHAYKIVFSKLEAPLDYLNGKEFIAKAGNKFSKIEKDLFGS